MRVAALLLLIGLAVGDAQAQGADPVDRMGVPGPLAFAGQSYHLDWSSRPAPPYYKQEYLPVGEAVERNEHMVLVEAHRAEWTDVRDALMPQMEALYSRRQTDALVNFDVIQNSATGEAILDFILGATDPDGVRVVEWNAYRYAISADAGGARVLLLFAISRRAYGDDITPFLENLRQERRAHIDALATLDLPVPEFADD